MYNLSLYLARVTYKGNTVETPRENHALRISVRETSYSTPDTRRTDYTNWLFAYLGVPYEYGGTWFGGKKSNNWVLQGDYRGYGIDCSALVSNAAKWAGYNWNTGYGTGGWRYVCDTLPSVTTTTFPGNDPFGVGDILNNLSDKHVKTVISINRTTGIIGIIEAAGEKETRASYEWANRATNASLVRVVRNLDIEDHIDQHYSKLRLVPNQ